MNAKEADEKRWGRRKSLLTHLKSDVWLEFQERTEKDLKFFFTGTYQLTQTVSYLAEMCDEDGNLSLYYIQNRQILEDLM